MNIKDAILNPSEILINDIEPNEIIGLRTSHANFFKGEGREIQAKIYSCPINYKNENVPINLGLKKKPPFEPLIAKYQYITNAGIYTAHFNKDKPYNYFMEIGNKWIEYEALFEETGDIKVEVDTSKVGVKETIILLNDKAPTQYSWRVTTNGLNPSKSFAADSEGNNVPVLVIY